MYLLFIKQEKEELKNEKLKEKNEKKKEKSELRKRKIEIQMENTCKICSSIWRGGTNWMQCDFCTYSLCSNCFKTNSSEMGDHERNCEFKRLKKSKNS